ncbi:MAG TPA: D-2-hydroxyacid dehydrogenase family protein [Bryobacteraceae bacterium]
MPVTKVAVLDDYQDAALQMADWSILDGQVELTIFQDHVSEPDAVAERLAPFDVICAMRERTPLRRPLLERLPNLKLIVSTAMRNASIDLAAAKEFGIAVCGTGYRSHGAAELTWALIMAAAKFIPEECASVRSGGWQTKVGKDLKGATLGIVGLGRLGATVAKYAHAFDMNVIAWSTNLTQEKATEHGARLVSKEQLFRDADMITLHLVLSERTRGIVGAAEFALMKPTAWLVNTSRGPLVDEAALIDVLSRKAIAGAALDVFDTEPLPPNHPLRSLPNALVTPHIGFVTEETYRIFYQDTVEAIRAWLNGRPVRQIN